jgi:hypothetical protein
MDIADIVERFKIIFLDSSSFDVFQDRMDLAEDKTTPLTWTEEMLFVFMVCLAHIQCVIVLTSRVEADPRRYSRPVENMGHLLWEETVCHHTFRYLDRIYWYVGVPCHMRIITHFTSVAGLYELGCDVETKWGFLATGNSVSSQGALSCARADMSTFTLSYATNIICTFLIFLRAWLVSYI